jgi:hypothetical protein
MMVRDRPAARQADLSGLLARIDECLIDAGAMVDD